MNFIKLEDERYNPVYIKASAIKAVYYDYKQKATAVDYNVDSTMYVQETPKKIFERLTQMKGGE